MIFSPILAEALEAVAVAAVGSSLVAPLASFLKKRVHDSGRTVVVKLPTGAEVHLELDANLSKDQVSEFISKAILSAQAGDERAVQQTISASREASHKARQDLAAV